MQNVLEKVEIGTGSTKTTGNLDTAGNVLEFLSEKFGDERPLADVCRKW